MQHLIETMEFHLIYFRLLFVLVIFLPSCKNHKGPRIIFDQSNLSFSVSSDSIKIDSCGIDLVGVSTPVPVVYRSSIRFKNRWIKKWNIDGNDYFNKELLKPGSDYYFYLYGKNLENSSIYYDKYSSFDGFSKDTIRSHMP